MAETVAQDEPANDTVQQPGMTAPLQLEPLPLVAEVPEPRTTGDSAGGSEPPPRAGRWSLFGNGEKPKAKPAKAEAFVAAKPARPPENASDARRTTLENPARTPESLDEPTPNGRGGFASLFSRKPAEAPKIPPQRQPAEDENVHLLPKQPVAKPSPSPTASTQTSEDVLEIPAFLRRQAR